MAQDETPPLLTTYPCSEPYAPPLDPPRTRMAPRNAAPPQGLPHASAQTSRLRNTPRVAFGLVAAGCTRSGRSGQSLYPVQPPHAIPSSAAAGCTQSSRLESCPVQPTQVGSGPVQPLAFSWASRDYSVGQAQLPNTPS
nr:hypothetical protein Itr_chr03CG10230 [Ipomoea trifida]